MSSTKRQPRVATISVLPSDREVYEKVMGQHERGLSNLVRVLVYREARALGILPPKEENVNAPH